MSSEEIDPHELIVAVQARTILYDRSDKLYGYRNFATAAWREVADEIGTDEVSARRKWAALRDYFTRLYRMAQDPNGKLKNVRWCFYKNMLFLRDHLEPNKAAFSQSMRFDYDPACADDMESASIVSFDQIKSEPETQQQQQQLSSEDEEVGEEGGEDSVPLHFEALEEEDINPYNHHRRHHHYHQHLHQPQHHHQQQRPRRDVTAVASTSTPQRNRNRNRSTRDSSSSGRSSQRKRKYPEQADVSVNNVSPPKNDNNDNNNAAGDDDHDDENEEEDHDELFLKSLLPDLKCVTDEISKMECKIEMQSVLLKFIRQSRSIDIENSSKGQGGCGGSSGSAHSNNQTDSSSDATT